MAASHDESNASHPRMRGALLAGAVAVLMAAFFGVHARQGLERPVPWIDEGYLLWQAHAFHREGSLAASQLLSEGPLLWMPPGYMIVAGLAFSVTGFSLEAARHLSAVFLAGAIAALAAVFGRLRHPFAGLLPLAAFALSPTNSRPRAARRAGDWTPCGT